MEPKTALFIMVQP